MTRANKGLQPRAGMRFLIGERALRSWFWHTPLGPQLMARALARPSHTTSCG